MHSRNWSGERQRNARGERGSEPCRPHCCARYSWMWVEPCGPTGSCRCAPSAVAEARVFVEHDRESGVERTCHDRVGRRRSVGGGVEQRQALWFSRLGQLAIADRDRFGRAGGREEALEQRRLAPPRDAAAAVRRDTSPRRRQQPHRRDRGQPAWRRCSEAAPRSTCGPEPARLRNSARPPDSRQLPLACHQGDQRRTRPRRSAA